MRRCKTCHEFTFSEFHKCPPAWWVWAEEDATESEALEDYAYIAYGLTEELAVENFAEKIHTVWEWFEDSRTLCVLPEAEPDAEPKKFFVSPEPNISWVISEL